MSRKHCWAVVSGAYYTDGRCTEVVTPTEKLARQWVRDNYPDAVQRKGEGFMQSEAARMVFRLEREQWYEGTKKK